MGVTWSANYTPAQLQRLDQILKQYGSWSAVIKACRKAEAEKKENSH